MVSSRASGVEMTLPSSSSGIVLNQDNIITSASPWIPEKRAIVGEISASEGLESQKSEKSQLFDAMALAAGSSPDLDVLDAGNTLNGNETFREKGAGLFSEMAEAVIGPRGEKGRNDTEEKMSSPETWSAVQVSEWLKSQGMPEEVVTKFASEFSVSFHFLN
ncbi:hypothetical protein HDU98_008957 [Podochytrium sp. JEL0797]|nr:hypothetical protein HDU98_008957 [Podochytrium sp. JEL0797]